MSSSAQKSAADLRISLTRLAREISRRLGDGSSPENHAFFSSVLRALARIKDGANISVRIQCLFDCAIFSYTDGANEQALAVMKLLDELAKRTKNSYWARRIAMYGGVIHADLGNVAEAVVRHSRALEIARNADDLAGEASVLCNLGAAMIYGGLYKEAVPCLQRAVQITQDNRDLVATIAVDNDPFHFEGVALTNLAQCHHLMGDKRRALELISSALKLSGKSTHCVAATSLALREATFVEIALDLGMVDVALAHARKCDGYVPAAGQRARLVAEVCQGLCEVHAGRVRVGIEILEAVLEKAGDVASVKMDVLKSLAQAYDQMNRPARAVAYIDQLIGMIHASRTKAIAALLQSSGVGIDGQIELDSDDLRALQLTQAQYRARAAEHRAAAAHLETLERLAITADLKEEASGGHGSRVGRLASLFAERLSWSREACHSLDLAGRLHDIGKIGLPDRVMLKPETLREAEHHFVAAHTKIGAEILSQGVGEPLRMAQEVARFHHERWDGAGYPYGLMGRRIPLSARIISLADVFDVMTHEQVYAHSFSVDDALAEIHAGLGTQFDPAIGARFIEFVRDAHRLHPDLGTYLGQASQNTVFSEARKRIEALLRVASTEPDSMPA